MLRDKIQRKNILVVGDVMLDIYINGKVSRISPEAPVPVLRKEGERIVLGGAANVAANLHAAKQGVSLMSVAGDDLFGKRLKELLQYQMIDSSMIHLSKERRTTIKTRIVGPNQQQIVRLDEEDNFLLSKQEENHLLELIADKLSGFDIIIMSDYMKGLLTKTVAQRIVHLAKAKNIPVLIDVKDPCVEKYRGAYLIKPNKKELAELTGMSVADDDDVLKAAQWLREKCECEYILVTCGSDGMVLVGDQLFQKEVNTAKDVFDVSGAGDTVISYLATFLANGINIKQAVKVANDAAGIKVSKMGTAPVTLEELEEYLEIYEFKIREMKKLVSREELKEILSKNVYRKIVFTNGCFDIIHFGHISYLQKAKTFGDLLIVGMNSDASVRRQKGPDRPINNESARGAVLAALECVDYVTIFDTDTPYDLIKEIQPSVLVKGADYKPDEVVGKDLVEEHGGKLELVSFVEGHSTSNMIERMK